MFRGKALYTRARSKTPYYRRELGREVSPEFLSDLCVRSLYPQRSQRIKQKIGDQPLPRIVQTGGDAVNGCAQRIVEV